MSTLYLLKVYQQPENKKAKEDPYEPALEEETLLFHQIVTLPQTVRDEAAIKYFKEVLSPLYSDLSRISVRKL